jgi:hypothetical protein
VGSRLKEYGGGEVDWKEDVVDVVQDVKSLVVAMIRS